MWRPIQMRTFHSNENDLLCSHPISVATLFLVKGRGKEEALILMSNSHLNRTDTTVSIDKYIMRAIFCFEFNTTVIKWLIHEKRPHVINNLLFHFQPSSSISTLTLSTATSKKSLVSQASASSLKSSSTSNVQPSTGKVYSGVLSKRELFTQMRMDGLFCTHPFSVALLLGGRKEASRKLSFE